MKKIVYALMLWLLPLAVVMAQEVETDFSHRTDIVTEYRTRVEGPKGYIDIWNVTDGPCNKRKSDVGLEFVRSQMGVDPITEKPAMVFYFAKGKIPDGGWVYVEGWYFAGNGAACLREISVRYDNPV